MRHEEWRQKPYSCRYSPCQRRYDPTANAALANIARQERRRKSAGYLRPVVRVWYAPGCGPAKQAKEVNPQKDEKRRERKYRKEDGKG